MEADLLAYDGRPRWAGSQLWFTPHPGALAQDTACPKHMICPTDHIPSWPFLCFSAEMSRSFKSCSYGGTRSEMECQMRESEFEYEKVVA